MFVSSSHVNEYVRVFKREIGPREKNVAQPVERLKARLQRATRDGNQPLGLWAIRRAVPESVQGNIGEADAGQ
jgi:hypothetical protein